MDFHLPPNFTRELYIQIIRKQYSCLRYIMYPRIQKKLTDSGKDELDEMQKLEIRDQITEEESEQYRKKVFELFEVKTTDPPKKVL